jgi:pyridoxal phosphate enzyme (YggS family)
MGNRVAQNIVNIRKRVEIAARKSGRSFEDIKVLGVTKNVSTENILMAMDEKILDFAENKVQEFLRKYDIFSRSCNWHFIGRLQTNKVKYIIDKVDLIHSVDRLDLLDEISKRASFLGKSMNILVQVNISGEATKSGLAERDLFEFLKEASAYPNVKIKGLMTMAPYYNKPEEARWIFREMFQLSIDLKAKKKDNISMDFLSMGMSNDFEVAIEEGANIVRLGSAIFK